MPNIQLPYNYSPRDYQLPLLDALDSGQKYAAIVWARRHGKDITCWNYAIKAAALTRMDVTYVYPTSEMGKNNLWEAKTNDGFMFTDFIPLPLRQRAGPNDDGLNNTFKQVTLFNGSIIRLMSAEKPDRLRGGNSKLYVLSEYAEMDPSVIDIIEPVVEANGGQILVNYTPKGDNHAKGSWESWQKDAEWFTQIIKATDTTVFTGDQLERIKARIIDRFIQQGRSETEAVAFFDQEYMCSFDTPVIGSYFGEGIRRAQQENRITNVPWEPSIPVYNVWDLGVGDSTAIWFYQTVGQEIHIIDYYETSGEGLPHYFKKLNEKPYMYAKDGYFAPHDIEVRELSSGKSRRETARELGVDFRIVPNLPKEDQIDAGRNLLNKCWFDKTKCERGLNALKNYSKEWDDKNKTYKDRPKHDWSSHGSDAWMYLAVSYQPYTNMEKAMQDLPDDTFEGSFYNR
jgi:phage terminase large subunit